MSRAITILKEFDLRSTGTRTDILDVFLATDVALAHGDIESKMTEGLDRVTLYRTLKTFLDKGIIHKVLDDEGTTKYALCRHSCTTEEHNHEHVHFKCTMCNNTVCLDHVTVPKISLPAGYSFQETNILVQGVCPECK
jgi:Fur family transcriptional regulator, ferric uptake regulator